MEPTKLTGKEFEEYCKISFETDRSQVAEFDQWRNGVKASQIGPNQVVTVKSLPDFSGLIDNELFNYDAKACSQASFALNKYHADKSNALQRQMDFMLRTAKCGATSFFLIHFNKRELALKTIEAQTWAFPVHPEHPFWLRFFANDEKSINLRHCDDYGFRAEWHIPKRCSRPRIKLAELIRDIRAERKL